MLPITTAITTVSDDATTSSMSVKPDDSLRRRRAKRVRRARVIPAVPFMRRSPP
jgi:hypothetical protein